MRRVEFIMGMPISVDIPSYDAKTVFEKAFDRLQKIDERFSPFKPDSEASKYIRGELTDTQKSSELTKIIRACRAAEKMTGGYFSAWAGGAFDPSGYVKGWAIAEAGKIIERQGYKTYCIGAGGDILAHSNDKKTWQIGIQDPTNKTKMLNMLSISNGAVATSGNYERGAHIFNPKTKKPEDIFLSVTITGPDIIKADILATAVFAMGSGGLAFIETQKGYEALVVDSAGQTNISSGGKLLFHRA